MRKNWKDGAVNSLRGFSARSNLVATDVQLLVGDLSVGQFEELGDLRDGHVACLCVWGVFYSTSEDHLTYEWSESVGSWQVRSRLD